MADDSPIDGACDPRFAEVRQALAANFRERGEVGAAVAVVVDGVCVVDLWGGWADRARTRPWRRDTLVNIFSAGKGMAATALLRLVEQGRLDVDLPVSRYWPQFAAQDKGDVTLRMVLGHRAGLPGIRRPLAGHAMYDHDCMARALAGEPPWWEPGRHHGYHVNTFGFLVGELVRRVCGERLGTFFRREVAGPLDADVHFGLAAEHDRRTAEHLLPDDDSRLVDHLLAAEGPQAGGDDAERRRMLEAIYVNPSGISGFGTVNTRAWRAAEMPSTNGHATARGLARVYAALAGGGAIDGVRILHADTIARATAEVSAGPDRVLLRSTRFGLGFQLTRPDKPFGPGACSFGHFGTGGSVGFADPDARLAFAYTINQPGPRWQNPRTGALIDAVYAAL